MNEIGTAYPSGPDLTQRYMILTDIASTSDESAQAEKGATGERYAPCTARQLRVRTEHEGAEKFIPNFLTWFYG